MTQISLPTIGIPMKKIKTRVPRLALDTESIRTLRGGEFADIAAGWECSEKGSGNILCIQVPSGDSVVCNAAKP